MKEVESAVGRAMEPSSTVVPAAGQVEYAFSPREGGENLVVKAIGSARHEVRLLAYSLTSPRVVRALIDAKKQYGADVKVLADFKQNVSLDKSGKARAALSALATAGIEVRTIDAYAIHHDKVAIVDRVTVQTGSFNYSEAAQKSNSENVIVLWNNPALAQGYLTHWERNWRQGERFQPAY